MTPDAPGYFNMETKHAVPNTTENLAAYAQKHSRLFFVDATNGPTDTSTEQTNELAWLKANMQLVDKVHTRTVDIYLFVPLPTPSSTPA